MTQAFYRNKIICFCVTSALLSVVYPGPDMCSVHRIPVIVVYAILTTASGRPQTWYYNIIN